jgi:hypothetical protein
MDSTHFRARLVSSLGSPAGVLNRKGVRRSCCCGSAGLTQQQIDDPGNRIAVRNQIRFLDLAATLLNDNCLDLRMSGLFYYVLASSETLGEALPPDAR